MASEIVKMVAKQAKLSEPIAQIAVDAVLSFLKGKLPPAIGSTLDSLVGSGSSSTSSKSTKKNDDLLGGLGDIAGTIGGLLGKK